MDEPHHGIPPPALYSTLVRPSRCFLGFEGSRSTSGIRLNPAAATAAKSPAFTTACTSRQKHSVMGTMMFLADIEEQPKDPRKILASWPLDGPKVYLKSQPLGLEIA